MPKPSLAFLIARLLEAKFQTAFGYAVPMMELVPGPTATARLSFTDLGPCCRGVEGLVRDCLDTAQDVMARAEELALLCSSQRQARGWVYHNTWLPLCRLKLRCQPHEDNVGGMPEGPPNPSAKSSSLLPSRSSTSCPH